RPDLRRRLCDCQFRAQASEPAVVENYRWDVLARGERYDLENDDPVVACLYFFPDLAVQPERRVFDEDCAGVCCVVFDSCESILVLRRQLPAERFVRFTEDAHAEMRPSAEHRPGGGRLLDAY